MREIVRRSNGFADKAIVSELQDGSRDDATCKRGMLLCAPHSGALRMFEHTLEKICKNEDHGWATIAMSAMRKFTLITARRQSMMAARTAWMNEHGIAEAAERITTDANIWPDLGSRSNAAEVKRQAAALGLTTTIVAATDGWRERDWLA